MGKGGLDIIFAVDISASVGDKSLQYAKTFMERIVNNVGVSPDPDGGKFNLNVYLPTLPDI